MKKLTLWCLERRFYKMCSKVAYWGGKVEAYRDVYTTHTKDQFWIYSYCEAYAKYKMYLAKLDISEKRYKLYVANK